MVMTKLSCLDKYAPIHPRFAAAFEALKKYASTDTPDGQIIVDGEDIFINVFSYDTAPADSYKYEGHKNYIDIQCIMAGNEDIKVVNIADAILTDEYYAEGDAAFYVAKDTETTLEMGTGDVAIFFPSDLHAPSLMHEAPSKMKKFVVKVRV